MKVFITISAEDRAFGDGNVIYRDAGGREYLGKPIDAPAGTLIAVEITSTPMPDGYYHIVRALPRLGKK